MTGTPLRVAAICAVLLVLSATPAVANRPVPVSVTSDGETVPVAHGGDTADDPAIWVNRAEPARSLVISNDKSGALETYDLAGRRVQRIADDVPFWGNVDVRGNIVAVYHDHGLRLFEVDTTTRLLSNVTEAGVIRTSGEGLCLYQASDALYAFLIVRASPSRTRQYALTDADGDGRYAGTLRRTFDVGSEAEGCVVDDENAALYVSQEDVALWRYGADPGEGASRSKVDAVVSAGGHLDADLEGVTLAGDRVIVSAQSAGSPSRSYFAVYDRATNHYVGAFRVTDGTASDDCDGTDGIAAYAGALGPSYPSGLFVCQDQTNQAPGANQNFKLVRWERLPV